MSLKAAIVGTTISVVCINVINLVTSVVTARSLGPDGRGMLALIVLWSSIGGVITGFGLDQSVIYFVSRATRDKKLTISIQVFVLTAALATLASACLIGAREIVIEYIDLSIFAVVIVAIYVFLTNISVTINGILLGFGLTREWNVATLSVYLAIFLFTGIVVASGYGTAETCAIAILLANVCSISLALSFIGKEIRAIGSERIVRVGESYSTLVSYGLKSYGAKLFRIAGQRADQIVISIYMDVSALGIYVVALALMRALETLLVSFEQLIFSSLSKANRDSNPYFGYLICVIGAFVLGGIVSLAIYYVAAGLVIFVFGSTFKLSVEVLEVSVLGLPAAMARMMLMSFLKAANRPWAATISELMTLVFFGALLFVLVSDGLTGVAWASVYANCLGFVMSALLLTDRSRTLKTIIQDEASFLRALSKVIIR